VRLNIQEYEIIVHNDSLVAYMLIILYKQPLKPQSCWSRSSKQTSVIINSLVKAINCKELREC